MQKRRRRLFLILIGVGVLVGVLAVVFRSPAEPEYGGKKLSGWVDACLSDSRPFATGPVKMEPHAVDAIRGIGTNGLPYLVKWMRYKPPIWKTRLYSLVNPVIRRVNVSWELTDDRKLIRSTRAALAFMSMGTNARPAMPLLQELLNDSNEVVRITASTLIFTIDPQAPQALKRNMAE